MRLNALAILFALLSFAGSAHARPTNDNIDTEVARLMTATSAKGLAVALIETAKWRT